MRYLTAFLVMILAATTLGQNPFETEAIFLNPASFEVDITPDETKWKNLDDLQGRESKMTQWRICLKNNSSIPLTDLRMSYCIYRNLKTYGKPSTVHTSVFNNKVRAVDSYATETVLTTPHTSFRTPPNTFLDEVAGIRIRIYLPMSNGSEVLREFCVPKSLPDKIYPWKDPEEKKLTSNTNINYSPRQTPLQPPASDSKYHTFKKADGTVLQARLLDFGASSGIVKLEMSDSSEAVMKLSAFADTDQSYIQDWYAAYTLLNRTGLQITHKKKTDSDQLYHGDMKAWNTMFPNMDYTNSWHSCDPGTKYDDISYTISLENMSGHPLTGIWVEYCIYHQTKINEESEMLELRKVHEAPTGRAWSPAGSVERYPEQTVSNIVHGMICFKTIPSDETQSQTTDTFKYVKKAPEFRMILFTNRSYQIGDKERNHRRTIEGKLVGIRYRIYVPTPAGNYAMMEFSDPESLIERTAWPNQ